MGIVALSRNSKARNVLAMNARLVTWCWMQRIVTMPESSMCRSILTMPMYLTPSRSWAMDNITVASAMQIFR